MWTKLDEILSFSLVYTEQASQISELMIRSVYKVGKIWFGEQNITNQFRQVGPNWRLMSVRNWKWSHFLILLFQIRNEIWFFIFPIQNSYKHIIFIIIFIRYKINRYIGISNINKIYLISFKQHPSKVLIKTSVRIQIESNYVISASQSRELPFT